MSYDTYLYRFRPSDRAKLLEAMKDEHECDQLFEDLVEYIRIWEESDWLDDYVIELIAKWFAHNAPEALLDRLHFFAEDSDSAARKTFRNGLAL